MDYGSGVAAEAFFVRLADRDATGERFRATEHTEGPWGAGLQHGGPPAALLGRAAEAASGNDSWITARVAVDILGPIPVGELTVRADVVRPGRSVELIQAELRAGERAVAAARAWRIRTAPDVVKPTAPTQVPPLPDTADQVTWPGGYVAAIEWRYAVGGFDVLGPATVWTRPRVDLVAGESMSPLQRVLLVADSGNGASSELPLSDFLFINPEVSVHLHRMPVGEWIGLQASTAISADGVGLAESRLFDRQGAIGRGAQPLLVGPREPGVG